MSIDNFNFFYFVAIKEKITAPGAGHGEAMYLLGDEYWDDVFAFLNNF